MHVTVFGATGAIGSLTVAELLSAGHSVTAYVRTPRKAPNSWQDAVRVVVGDISDAHSIDQAVEGADAVISALGPSTDRRAQGTPLVPGTRNIIEAMQRHGVSRFIGHATPSVLDPRERPTVRTRMISSMPRLLLPRAYAEITGMSRVIMDSDRDWTIVRFILPTNGPRKGGIRAGYFGTDRIGFSISRADIATFTAEQLHDRRYLRRAPTISS